MKNKAILINLSAIVMFSLLMGCQNSGKKGDLSKTPTLFEPTLESLGQYQCPEWFRDAKFGIYCHWNAQSSAKSSYNEWYARELYMEGHRAYKDHLKNWGHPSEVGYKDVIKAWEADKFDAKHWVKLFKDAGARYIITMAVHCDNFDMWNSKYQPRWNSTNYGPKRDVAGDIRKEALKAGLRWGVTTHASRAYSWVQTNKGADTTGSMKGVPYDGNDPEYEDLYLPWSDDSNYRQPLDPPESWKEHWKMRMFDLIDNYHPDHFYFDGALPFMNDSGKAGMEVIAHYYNHNAARHGGKNEGVMVIKDITEHGFFYPGISSVVMERRRSDEILSEPRETENSIGPWFYSGRTNYRSAQSLLHEMIDVVSKNCNFLLNIPPRGDGSFDEGTLEILSEFGRWLGVNGEAIYETRPWTVFGEENIRYTVRDNMLYAIMLEKDDNPLTLISFSGWPEDAVKKVELLGSGTVSWERTENGLKISLPPDYKDDLAYVFKVSCTKPLQDLPAVD